MLPTYYRGSGILFIAPDSSGTVKLLLGQRLFRPNAGTWSVPGGGMSSEDCGDFRRCAAREVFEETVGLPRLDCLRIHLLDRLDSAPQSRIHVPFAFDFRVFLVPLTFTPALDLWPNPANWQEGEFGRFEWFKPDQLPTPLHHGMVTTIKRLEPHIRGAFYG